MIGDVARNLESLSPEQYVLAYAFLCSYALAVGRLLERRGRTACAGLAAAAAVGFVAGSPAWEPGVVVIAFALVGLGAVGAGAWLFWTLAHRGQPVPAPRLAAVALDAAAEGAEPACAPAGRRPSPAFNAPAPSA